MRVSIGLKGVIILGVLQTSVCFLGGSEQTMFSFSRFPCRHDIHLFVIFVSFYKASFSFFPTIFLFLLSWQQCSSAVQCSATYQPLSAHPVIYITTTFATSLVLYCFFSSKCQGREIITRKQQNNLKT